MTLQYLELVYKIAYLEKKLELALKREEAVQADEN